AWGMLGFCAALACGADLVECRPMLIESLSAFWRKRVFGAGDLAVEALHDFDVAGGLQLLDVGRQVALAQSQRRDHELEVDRVDAAEHRHDSEADRLVDDAIE